MTVKLTSEQREAIASSFGTEPLVLVDEQSGREYVLLEKQTYNDWLVQEIDSALKDVDAGRV
jgi:hypothetical protein